MPDLREVFEMVKQQTEPDKDSWAEQERTIRNAQRKRKYGALALVAALAAVIAVVVASNLDADDQGVAPATNGPSTPVVTPGSSQLTFLDIATGATTGTGIVPGASAVDVSPDGTKMTYVNTGRAVAVANIDGSDPQPFPHTVAVDDPSAPRWSPDGTKIVFQREGAANVIGNLYILDVATGRVEQITHLPSVSAGLNYMAPTFSADGRSVLFTMPKKVGSGPTAGQLEWDLWTVPASGGDATLLVKNAGFADAEPNGDSIAYVALQSDGKGDPTFGDTYVAGSDGGGARKLAEGQTLLPRWSPDGSEIAFADMGKPGTFVVDVATGDLQKVYASDEWPEWVDPQTLIIDLSD
jgi:dipeptidyl aminopeptidase/acylaminoacyl peptidase